MRAVLTTVGKCFRSPFLTSVVVGMVVFLGIMGLRSTGNLEFLELVAYDWYIRLRPETSTSAARIALIGITERDIRAQGRWPLPDATLAQVLSALAQYQPRAIGLDIYRDVQV